ncbi:MAG: Dipeptide transport system permease protein DppB [Firmicutes bacterium]|nr:Dipeptide transport system permease protein DppB [candidate division NPL-UPA2 bacterium]
MAPGSFAELVGEDIDATVEDNARLIALWGLDQPVHIQYLRWVRNVLGGNFGRSLVTARPVFDMIMERMPATIVLNLLIVFFVYLLALPVGIISAVKQYSWFDHIMTFLAFIGSAMPGFFFAMMLIYYVAMNFELVPISGLATFGVEWGQVPFMTWLGDRLRYLILPLTVGIFGGLAGLVRFMRASMLDEINQDYVRTARAKGLSEGVVIFKHALRNSLLPIVTTLGFTFSGMLGGSIIIESIFAWPGVGLLALGAIFTRDYQVIMAFNLMGATMLVLGMLVADILYVVVDPRIKY